MKKLYFFILFISMTCLANAQEARTTEASVPEMLQSKSIKFYPNPATTVINFELLKVNQRDVILQVFNFVGKKVYELNAVNQKTTLPLTDFYRGIYIFQLRDKSGRIIESGKFQVVK